MKNKIELILGDSLEYIKKLQNKSIDCIITDPPYKVSSENEGGSLNEFKGFKKSLEPLKENNLVAGYCIENFNQEFVRIMKNVNIYIWTSKEQIKDYFKFYVLGLGCKFDILSWHKTNALPTYSNKYLTDTEYCLYFRKGGFCEPANYEDAKTFWFEPINHKDKKKWGHPTIKPLSMIEKLVRNSTKEGEVVLDPFMGSGTTGVAAKAYKRRFIGVEINEKYFNIAKSRIENTQEKNYQKPVKAGTLF